MDQDRVVIELLDPANPEGQNDPVWTRPASPAEAMRRPGGSSEIQTKGGDE